MLINQLLKYCCCCRCHLLYIFYLFLQYYVVVTTCPNCSGHFRLSAKIYNETSFNQSLYCGQTFDFTVTAVTTHLGSSNPSKTSVSLTSADVGLVANLIVNYVPANLSDVNIEKHSDRFLLTWDPPKHFSQDKIQV